MEPCKFCKKIKAVSEYYFRLGKPMMRCKECQRSYAGQWSALSKEKIMETKAKYNLSKYRAKSKNASINVGVEV